MPLFKKKEKDTSHHTTEGNKPYTTSTGHNEPGYPTQTDPSLNYASAGSGGLGSGQTNDPYARAPGQAYESRPGDYGTARATGAGFDNEPLHSHGLGHGHGASGPGPNDFSMGGSKAFKAKSTEKEREAEALRQQGNDLARAEGLEHEAQRLRQGVHTQGGGGLRDNLGTGGNDGRTQGF